jgi:bacterioferritin-associated ferredoxin
MQQCKSTFLPESALCFTRQDLNMLSASYSTNGFKTCPVDEVMCHCSGSRRCYIKSLFEQGKDLDAISCWTGELSVCGECEWDIAGYLT